VEPYPIDLGPMGQAQWAGPNGPGTMGQAQLARDRALSLGQHLFFKNVFLFLKSMNLIVEGAKISCPKGYTRAVIGGTLGFYC
jgi:hypothetical protein